MTIKEVLQKARALIADPERWTREALARTSEGWEVRGDNPTACRWCVVGAIQAIALGAGVATWPATVALLPFIPHHADVPSWNDDPKTTHADVLAAFDAAIARAEE